MSSFYHCSAILHFGIWTWLVIHGMRAGLAKRYRLLHLWIVVSALCAGWLIAVNAVWGENAEVFAHLYYLTISLVSVLAALLLRQIQVIAGVSRGWRLQAFWLSAAFLSLSLLLSDSHPYLLLTTAFHLYLVLAGFSVLWSLSQKSRIIIGRNWSGVLAGIMFPSTLAGFNFVAYLALYPWLSTEVWSYLLESARILSWGMIAWGMRQFDPPFERSSQPDQALVDEAIHARLKAVRNSI